MSSVDTTSGQLAFALAIDDRASFENFWIGENAELVSALQDAIGLCEHRVIFYYGVSGAGKSHLMFATGKAARANSREVSYLSLADDYVGPEMLETLRLDQIVCIDNADHWVGDLEKERALFSLFEQVKHAQGQLIISAVKTPELAGFKLPDLVSRLGSGLIYPLHALDDSQRLQALKLRATHRGLAIADDVLKYLVTRVSRDNRELFGLLEEIDHASLVEKRRVTIPFLQNLLRRRSH